MLYYSKDKTYDTMLKKIGYGTIKKLFELEGSRINDFVLGGVRRFILINFNNLPSALYYESTGVILTEDHENIGKCEVDKDKDCAWVLIYKELEKKNKLGTLKEVRQPKDHKKSLRPRKLVMAK